MQNVSYKIKKRESKVVIPKNPGFGQHFTDHVFEMDYNEKEGWHNCSIKPLDTLSFPLQLCSFITDNLHLKE